MTAVPIPDILSRIAERIARRYRNRDEDDNLQGLNTEDVIRILAASELAPVGKVLEAAQAVVDCDDSRYFEQALADLRQALTELQEKR